MRRALRIPLYVLVGCGLACAGEKSWEQWLEGVQQHQRDGNLAQAEADLLRALGETAAFPPGDVRRAVTLYNLGSVYQDLGSLAKAEKSYQQSLSAWEAAAGADHPSLSRPLSGLVALYMENGQYAKAERLHRRYAALPATPQLLHTLAALYHARRKYPQAESLYRQALANAEKPFGQDVAQLLNNLALLYAKTGRRPEAGATFERAVAIAEKALGPGHPNVARALSNWAAFACSQRLYADAEPLFQRALATAEQALGPENPLVGRILAEYALLLRKTKRKAEAAALDGRARAIRESSAYEALGRYTVSATDLLQPAR
jgi:tetratricopeptide (TPR) repeat protein